jgi:hypothetical protein
MNVEKRISVPLSLKEVALINELRRVPFGTIEVHKVNDIIERIVISQSVKVTEVAGAQEIMRQGLLSTNIIELK